MTTLVYSPEVTIHIATADGTVIDVTSDISRGSLTRVRNAPSALEFDLINQSRKYDGVFDSMDRLVVYLRRIRKMLCFSGYLDTVPVFSAVSGSIHLSATCTLKRLQQFMWDPTTSASHTLFQQADVTNRQDLSDGGMAQRTIDLLHEVAGWPTSQIHIGAVPTAWFDKVKGVSDELVREADKAAAMAAVGSASYVGGATPITEGLQTLNGRNLPATTGRATEFGVEAGGAFALTAPESPRNPTDPWYCAMRWPYAVMGPSHGDDIRNPAGINLKEEMAFWRNRNILVVNPTNQKAVVVRAADWGPATWTGNVIDLSPTAMKALSGVQNGAIDTVHIAFAPEGAKPGPVTLSTSASAQVGQALSAAGAGDPSAWGDPGIGDAAYARDHIVTITAGGVSVRVNKIAAARFTGLLNELSQHYTLDQAHTGAYVHRPITGGSGWSNHAYGGAVDVNWDRNPYGHPQAHQFDDNLVRTIAHKWGFYWGGDYDGNRDYMHFEVAEAPRTPSKAMAYSRPDIESGNTPVGTEGRGTAQDPNNAAPSTSDIAGMVAGALFNVYQWIGGSDFGGDLLTGIRSLMNDEPLLKTVESYMTAALRDYCSAPNGDFIGWFPDYFGWWGTSAKMVIQPIEIIQSFSVAKSDQYLKTHYFVMGSNLGVEGEGDASSIVQQLGTAGIASVEMPELMRALFNTDPGLFADGGKAFLNRYGARPWHDEMDNITGHLQEFFFAVFRFMQNWAEQYSAKIDLTFMPELWPGMLACFPLYGVQAYVDSVRHDWNLGTGGGFTTSPTLIGWSTLGDAKTAIKGLPKGAPL